MKETMKEWVFRQHDIEIARQVGGCWQGIVNAGYRYVAPGPIQHGMERCRDTGVRDSLSAALSRVPA